MLIGIPNSEFSLLCEGDSGDWGRLGYRSSPLEPETSLPVSELNDFPPALHGGGDVHLIVSILIKAGIADMRNPVPGDC